jgi:trigger factor
MNSEDATNNTTGSGDEPAEAVQKDAAAGEKQAQEVQPKTVKKTAKSRAKSTEKKEIITAKTAKKSSAAKKEPEETDTGQEKMKTGKEEGENGDPLSVTFTVEVPVEKIEHAFNEAVVKYASEIKLPGFRRGKVPLDVIRTRFQDAINEEVEGKVVETAVREKIDKDKMKIISRPEVLNIDHQDGKDLKAEVRVEVYPDIPLPDFSTIEVEIPAADLKMDPYDEQKQIDAVLEGNRRQVPVVGRPIKDSDYVNFKFQSKILATKRMTPRKDGQFLVDAKAPSELMDFYKEIVGKKLDDEFTFTRTYPADYKKKPWAGKEAEHYVKIEGIFEMVKPEFNQDFLKTIGFEDEESFKKKLKEEYDQYSSKNADDRKLNAIVEKVSEAIVFPVPRSMVAQEVSRSIQQQQQYIAAMEKEKMQEHIERLKTEAEKSLRFSFIVEAIKEEHKLEVGSEDLEKEYKTIAEQNNVPVKEVRKFYMQKENAQNLKEVLMKNKVMDFLKENVKIKEV